APVSVRIRIAVPATGPGDAPDAKMHEWLDQNAGADGWATTPSGERGVLMTRRRSIWPTRRLRARLWPAGAPAIGPRAGRSIPNSTRRAETTGTGGSPQDALNGPRFGEDSGSSTL